MASLQLHQHTQTCVKSQPPGTVPSNRTCRMMMPRPLVMHSHAICNGGDNILLRRHSEHLVPCIPSMMAAQPCNQAIYFCCEASR